MLRRLHENPVGWCNPRRLPSCRIGRDQTDCADWQARSWRVAHGRPICLLLSQYVLRPRQESKQANSSTRIQYEDPRERCRVVAMQHERAESGRHFSSAHQNGTLARYTRVIKRRLQDDTFRVISTDRELFKKTRSRTELQRAGNKPVVAAFPGRVPARL